MSVALVREIAAAHRGQRGALLPILHAVQEALGYVPPEAIPVLADELNLSRADVHGVVPSTTTSVPRLPAAPPCASAGARPARRVGAERLVSHLRDRCGMSTGGDQPRRFTDR